MISEYSSLTEYAKKFCRDSNGTFSIRTNNDTTIYLERNTGTSYKSRNNRSNDAPILKLEFNGDIVSHYPRNRSSEIVGKVNLSLVEARINRWFSFNSIQEEMKKTGSVIAGSFPLQCHLEEVWVNTDVDIFIPIGERPETHSLIEYLHCCTDGVYYDLTGVESCRDKYEFADIVKVEQWEFCKVRTEDSVEAKRTYRGDDEYLTVQVIQVNILEDGEELSDVSIQERKRRILRFIDNDFDFDFCKVYYDDGIKLMYPLSVKHKECIVDKDYYRSHHVDNKTVYWNRVNKYKQRGFTVHTEGVKHYNIGLIGHDGCGKSTYLQNLGDGHSSVVTNVTMRTEDTESRIFIRDMNSVTDVHDIDGFIIMYDFMQYSPAMAVSLEQIIGCMARKPYVMVANKCDLVNGTIGLPEHIAVSAKNSTNLLEPISKIADLM